MTKTPWICAHAGCEGTPLNSLESIAAGLQAGADVVELDLRFTSDGRAVLSHDRVKSRPRSPLVPLDQALGLLAQYPHVAINFDIKELQRLARFPNPLTQGTVVNPVYCTGLRGHQLGRFRSLCPGVDYALTFLPWWFALVPQGVRIGYLRRQKRAGATALNVSVRVVGPELLEAARCVGLAVGVWTIDAPEELSRLANLGVDGITTNQVSLARGLWGPPDTLGKPRPKG